MCLYTVVTVGFRDGGEPAVVEGDSLSLCVSILSPAKIERQAIVLQGTLESGTAGLIVIVICTSNIITPRAGAAGVK